MEGEMGNDPTLHQDPTLFLAEGMAKEWDDAPSPSTPVSKDSPQPPPVRALNTIPIIQEGLGLKSQPNNALVDPCPDPNQG